MPVTSLRRVFVRYGQNPRMFHQGIIGRTCVSGAKGSLVMRTSDRISVPHMVSVPKPSMSRTVSSAQRLQSIQWNGEAHCMVSELSPLEYSGSELRIAPPALETRFLPNPQTVMTQPLEQYAGLPGSVVRKSEPGSTTKSREVGGGGGGGGGGAEISRALQL